MECRRWRLEVQTLLLPLCALCKFHLTDCQNTREKITRGRRSKRVWSNCTLRIPFIQRMCNNNPEIRQEEPAINHYAIWPQQGGWLSPPQGPLCDVGRLGREKKKAIPSRGLYCGERERKEDALIMTAPINSDEDHESDHKINYFTSWQQLWQWFLKWRKVWCDEIKHFSESA